jgi:hypothetical protein
MSWHEGGYYTSGSISKWLHVTAFGVPAWTLGASGSGAYTIDGPTDARLRAATRQTDGSFHDPSGAAWWLQRSGSAAVAVDV